MRRWHVTVLRIVLILSVVLVLGAVLLSAFAYTTLNSDNRHL